MMMLGHQGIIELIANCVKSYIQCSFLLRENSIKLQFKKNSYSVMFLI